jgi:hypothetical protein
MSIQIDLNAALANASPASVDEVIAAHEAIREYRKNTLLQQQETDAANEASFIALVMARVPKPLREFALEVADYNYASPDAHEHPLPVVFAHASFKTFTVYIDAEERVVRWNDHVLDMSDPKHPYSNIWTHYLLALVGQNAGAQDDL